MVFYVQQILKEAMVVVKLLPGAKATFTVNEESVLLVEEERKGFHSMTAKLLYLAERARPDILKVVSFLCTRVQAATEEDQSKLACIIGYLKGTQDRTLLLWTQGQCVV
jgi:hypothetical protein